MGSSSTTTFRSRVHQVRSRLVAVGGRERKGSRGSKWFWSLKKKGTRTARTALTGVRTICLTSSTSTRTGRARTPLITLHQCRRSIKKECRCQSRSNLRRSTRRSKLRRSRPSVIASGGGSRKRCKWLNSRIFNTG